MTEQVVGSMMPAEDGYGQNGYSGPSSDLPGERTKIDNKYLGMATEVSSAPGNWQTRTVSQESYPIAFGNHKPAAPEKIPAVGRGR